MSVILLPIASGGWLNAATIQLITSDSVAVVPDSTSGEDMRVTLSDDWADVNSQLILGEGAVREIEANLAGINGRLIDISYSLVRK